MPKKDRYGIIHAYVYRIGGELKTIRGDVELDSERNLVHVYYKKVGSTKHTRLTFHVGPHFDNQVVKWQAGGAADKAFVTFKDYSHVEMIEISSFANQVVQSANFLSIVDNKGKEHTFDLRTFFVSYETTWRNDSLMWAERGMEPPKVIKDDRKVAVQRAVRQNTKPTKVGNFTRKTSRN